MKLLSWSIRVIKILMFQGLNQEQTAYNKIVCVWQITICICFASTNKAVLDDGLKYWLFTDFIIKM
jgi:hypothetical protein